MLDNLFTNPSLETGAGDPWIPTGFNNLSLDAGDTEAEAGIVHSGAGSLQFNATALTNDYMRNNMGDMENEYATVGFWSYNEGQITGREGARLAHQATLDTLFSLLSGDIADWQHTTGVGRGNAQSPYIQIYGRANVHYIDDIYMFLLDPVSLTVTPASEANSQENGGIQVGGMDTCTIDITGLLGATSGTIRFKWTPRHGDGDFEKFWVSSYVAFFFAYKNYENRFLFYSDSNDVLKFHITSDGGGLSSDTDSWDAAGITAGTTYLVEIHYTNTQCTLSIDGVVVLTAAPGGGIDFGSNIPHTAYMGTDSSNIRQGDSVFSAP